MRKVLIICNTYYQLIVAIQMRLTIMSSETVHIVLTNKTKGSYEVYKRLGDIKLFDVVSYVECLDDKKVGRIVYDAYYLWGGLFGSDSNNSCKGLSYDELVGYNFDLHTHVLYANLLRANPLVEINKLEEGLLSYDAPYDTSRLLSMLYKVRECLGLRNLRSSARNFYCFIPKAYEGRLKAVKIPRISHEDEKLRETLLKVFFGETKIATCKEKYVFLPCVYDFEGGKPIGELELAKTIAHLVGLDNLVIKVHPRDNASRFSQAGLKVVVNSNVPWESLVINGDYKDKVILTTLSGSLLTSSAMIDSFSYCYYLFPLCNLEGNQLAEHFSRTITRYVENRELPFHNIIRICQDMNSLVNALSI